MRPGPPVVLAFALLGQLAAADEPPRLLSVQDVLDQIESLLSPIAEVPAKVESAAAVREATPNPRAAKQAAAPSAGSEAVSPVDRPSLTESLALAFDQGLVDSAGGQVTFNLNGYGLGKLLRPDLFDNNAVYQSLSPIRRLGGRISLGGTGAAFDRDGDGTVDDALRAEKLSDSVAWEIQYRVLGTRDRRDRKAAARILGAVNSEQARLSSRYHALLCHAMTASETCAGIGEGIAEPLFKERLQSAPLQTLLREVQDLQDQFLRKFEQEAERSDRSFVLSLVSSGVSRPSNLGPRELSFGARAGWGTGPLDHTVNATWARSDGLAGQPRPTEIKLGYEASGKVLPGVLANPAQLGLFASWERNRNVPNAKHDTAMQLGARLELPIASGLSVPLTVKWVNHRDLFADADEFVGNLGIAVDFSELSSKRSAQP